jgi:hypothetical protein
MADFDTPVLPVVVPNNADLMVESFDSVTNGQRTTDARVSEGFLGTARQINQDVMYLDAEANRNAQFNARNIADLSRQQAATDRNVDEADRHLADGQRTTDANVNSNALWLDRSVSDVDRDVNAGVRHLDGEIDGVSRDVYSSQTGLSAGQRHTDDQVNGTARWLDGGQRDINRNVDSSSRWLGGEVHGVDKDVLQGFTGVANGQRDTDDRVSDGFQGTARDVDAARRDSAQGFWGVERGQRLSDDRNSDGFNRVERDILGGHASTDRNVDHGFFGVERGRNDSDRSSDAHFAGVRLGQAGTDRNVDDRYAQTSDHLGRVELGQALSDRNVDRGVNQVERGLNDSERRTDNRIDAAERRIEATTRHGYEELSRDASAADRRHEARLTGIAHDVTSEAQLTRDAAQRGELETRLYLRDREDRTEDLIRQLADRNLFEMQNFERRDRDDHDRTRALVNHKDDLRAERDLIRNTAVETQLRTKIDVLEACRPKDPCGDRGREREVHRYDPRININLTDLVEDEARSGAAAFNRFHRERRFDHNFNGNGSGDGNVG